ncbi:DUF5954 family protein [Streptomyces geranii]|uniref:DUF5954 family protein n=1 Tax=Streptomyces geranii TaxID=2058923 RepID=UPI001E5E3191|nr:DUF5954 family protein [Streptomyces geranii]
MSDYRDHVPAYLTIRVTAQEGPIAAFAEQEAAEAAMRYPDLMGVGIPEFFHAKEREAGGWELFGYGNDTPQGSRDSLGSVFRLRASEAEEAGDETARRKWMAAALRMDREVVNDLRVRGERFRIVRASRFVRMGPNGPEPPRPSDPDPAEVGEAYRVGPRTKGFVVDPVTGTGLSDGILKLDLIQFVGIARGAPQDVRDEARRALHTHPGGVLLPAVYMISERVEGSWRSHNPGASHSTPQGARDSLAYWLRVMAPYHRGLTDEKAQEYASVADRVDERRLNVATVDGVRYRVTRVERLVRVGPDGPEGPRPSDWDPEPPVEVQTRELKAKGLWREEDDDEPVEFTGRTLELKRRWDAEEARRTAVREKRSKAKEEALERAQAQGQGQGQGQVEGQGQGQAGVPGQGEGEGEGPGGEGEAGAGEGSG